MKSRFVRRDQRATLDMGLVLALLTLLCVASGLAGQEAVPEHFFDSDGVRIRYLDHGEGEAVVLLHGFALSAEVNWGLTGLLGTLPHEYRLLALDQRGHGRSDKPHDPESYGMEFVEDVIRLLDALEIERAHIVGYSMGGALALRLAADYPDRVRSAVIGGAGWAPPGSPLPAALLEWPAKIQRIAEEGGSLTDAMWQPGWPDPTPEIRAFLDSNDARALAAVLQGRPDLDLPAASVRAIEVPMLAVVGETDFARTAVDALVGVKPDVEVSVLAGKNHATAAFDAELGQVVLEFLRQQR
jgi:pimeloyl-ACP methyl ester carboxylesterase